MNNSNEVRKGNTQAKFNESNAGILYGEILILSIAVGIALQSWWAFGGILLGLMIIVNIKSFAGIVCVLFAICWGVIGFYIGKLFHSTGASVVLAIIAFGAGLGGNFSSLEYIQDLNSDNK